MNREEILEQMMECLDQGALLPPYIQAQVDADPDLAQTWQELQRLEDDLPPALDSGEQLPDGLHQRIIDCLPARPPETPAQRIRRLTLVPLALAAALALFFLLRAGEETRDTARESHNRPLDRLELRAVSSEPIRESREKLRETRQDFIESTGRFWESTVSILPRLPEGVREKNNETS